MNFGIIKLGLGAVVVGGLLIFLQFNTNKNYTLVPAKVLASNIDCYVANKDAERKKERYRYRIKNLTCNDVDTRYKTKLKYRKWYRVEVKFEYTSPVDGSRQTGSADRDRQLDTDYALARGTQIEIYAHNEQPGSYTMPML